LDKVDALLEQCGSDKTNILSTTIWLKDMSDFAEMNAVWDAWVPTGHAPARATGEAALATPQHLVEVIVVAAKP
jgi:enamine deaminase RidA (YjgF/YER057c/UK114 family)